MAKYLNLYCPECDMEIRAFLEERDETLFLRGEKICYKATVAVCPTCSNIIGDARIEGANLERAYDIYREKRGILSPTEIKKVRNFYDLSLREFSKFLGFGEQTVYRYEHGDIPDQSHNTALLSAKTAEGARLLLAQNRSNLNDKSICKIEKRIQNMNDGAAENAPRTPILKKREMDPPSPVNGYRKLCLDRLIALVFMFASKCKDLYWTKFQKAIFFADMVYFRRNGCSLTGLSYAHATFGPIINGIDETRYMLARSGAVKFIEHGWGEILLPLKSNNYPIKSEEAVFIEEIACFVNSFNSASELSDFSHKLSCWKASADGQIITYSHNDSKEVETAVIKRMKSMNIS